MAITARSRSCAVVRQLHTESRMQRLWFQVVPPKKDSPERSILVTGRSVCLSCSISVESASGLRNRTRSRFIRGLHVIQGTGPNGPTRPPGMCSTRRPATFYPSFRVILSATCFAGAPVRSVFRRDQDEVVGNGILYRAVRCVRDHGCMVTGRACAPKGERDIQAGDEGLSH